VKPEARALPTPSLIEAPLLTSRRSVPLAPVPVLAVTV
jgi:hypothetical protein